MSGRSNTEILYGRNAVIEALNGRRRVRHVLLAEQVERQPRIASMLQRARDRGVPVRRASRADLDRLTAGANHQGVAAEATPYPYVALDQLLEQAEGQPLVLLDHVQDVQNLGTLIRSAEASGSAGVIIPDRRAAWVTPAVVNASAGAVEHLAVARVANLARAVAECKEAGYWSVGLDAEPPAVDIYTATIPEPALLVVGSEGKGIGPSLLRQCDVVVRLPMLGSIESLNASVAGSIALYEILRRRFATRSGSSSGLVGPTLSD